MPSSRTRPAGRPPYGVRTGEVTVDFPVAIQRVHTLIDGMRAGLRDWLVGVDGLELVTGTATLVGDPEGRAHQVTVGGETHHTGKVYLDVGGRAAVPPIEGLDAVDAPDRGRAARS